MMQSHILTSIYLDISTKNNAIFTFNHHHIILSLAPPLLLSLLQLALQDLDVLDRLQDDVQLTESSPDPVLGQQLLQFVQLCRADVGRVHLELLQLHRVLHQRHCEDVVSGEVVTRLTLCPGSPSFILGPRLNGGLTRASGAR